MLRLKAVQRNNVQHFIRQKEHTTTLRHSCTGKLKGNLFLFALKWFPFVKRDFTKGMKELENKVYHFVDQHTFKKAYVIPLKGVSDKTINEKINKLMVHDQQSEDSKQISGTKYYHIPQFEESIKEFSKNFFYHNQLHPDVYCAIRQIEAEVIQMTIELFAGVQTAYGVMTSGGTESITMACLAYRDQARDLKGITHPEIITSITAHPAFSKACHYFGIKQIIVDADADFKINLKQVRKRITKNTIALVGSCPAYTHGIVDPIQELGQIALQNNIGLHVDCCLGSFIIPFAKECNVDIGGFNFKVPGVTSMSIDHHKHGLAPKGASIVIYKENSLRHYQYYKYFKWPGGCYATPAFSGSRSGAPIAGAWYAMMHLGREGYLKNAKDIFHATRNLVKKINEKIPDLQVFGDPMVNVVSFGKAANSNIDMFQLHAILAKKQWNLGAIQFPSGIHISVTNSNYQRLDKLVNDIIATIQEIKENPDLDKVNMISSIYGISAKIPDMKTTNDTLNIVLDQILRL